MKDIIIRSDCLTVHVNALGAELKSVEMDGLEYLWQGDRDSYARTSPTLFPIVGRFLSDTYYVGDRAFHMPLNGIAMDLNFECVQAEKSAAVFRLRASDSTREAYPFAFLLEVAYRLEENNLYGRYRVENAGDTPMPFGIGCHTAYNWPLVAQSRPEDWMLRFEVEENLESFNPFGWRQPFVAGKERPLHHDLFSNYTRSLTGIRSKWIEYASPHSQRRVRIYREGFPFLAIWSLPQSDARLICLEPCTSIHAGDHGCTRLEDREGTEILQPGASWEREFHLAFY